MILGFLKLRSYYFVGIDSNGVNAFFVNHSRFESAFLEKIKGIEFRENIYMKNLYRDGWEDQIKFIKKDLFIKID